MKRSIGTEGHWNAAERVALWCPCGELVSMRVKRRQMGRWTVSMMVDDLRGHDCGTVKVGDVLSYDRLRARMDEEDPEPTREEAERAKARKRDDTQSNLTWF